MFTQVKLRLLLGRGGRPGCEATQKGEEGEGGAQKGEEREKEREKEEEEEENEKGENVIRKLNNPTRPALL